MTATAEHPPSGEAPTARPTGGVQVARVLGVPILVAPSWLLFAAFVVAVYGPALSASLGPVRAYTAAVSFALLLLLSVLLHELGHCVVARAFGLPVRSITITFLAGLTEITEPPQTPGREYAVAIVGPMVSLLLAGLGAAMVPLFEPASLPQLIAVGVAAVNGVVALFNLLPGLPLDGGRVLRAGLWRLTGDAEGSTVTAARTGRVMALVVVPAGVLLGLPAAGLGRPTLATAVFTGLVAAFVFAGATASLRRAELVQRLPEGTVGALARSALGVPASLPLAEVVRRAHQAGSGAVLVVDDGGVVAVVSETAVAAVPEHRRPWLAVGDVARRVDADRQLDRGLGGEDLLAALRRDPSAEHLVRPERPGLPDVLTVADVARRAEPSRGRARRPGRRARAGARAG